MTESDERFDRQTAFFGAEGQARLQTANVAILGLGGLGSHIVQQLAYLGVRRYVLVDHDTVATTNLNRLIGATSTDVGAPKVRIAERLVHGVRPEAEFVSFDKKLVDPRVSAALSDVDIIVGGFDNDYARLLALTEATRVGVPYVDAATDITDDGQMYGGRVVVSGQGQGCLSCRGLLDQDDIRRHQMTDEQLEAEARSYGIPVDELRPRTGPSVVTLNGVVASIAATEMMAITTGLRAGWPVQSYYASWGRVTTTGDAPAAECYYCASSNNR